MDSSEEKDLIKKMFTSHLKPDERKELNEHDFVDKALHKEWDATSDVNLLIDDRSEKRMFERIMRRIEGRYASHSRLFYWSWAASIAVLLVCGTYFTTILTRKPTLDTWFIFNSGRQSVDSLMLSDGTSVMLNSDSRLTYPKTFGNKREVLLSGQAFFKVHHDAQHPFTVKTRDMNVTALGTQFEVFSYEHDKTIETTLLQGKVRVDTRNPNHPGVMDEHILYPNEKLTYNRNGMVIIEKVNADNYLAWRNGGRLSFRDTPLADILPRLEKWYEQKITCSPDIASHYRFTFTIHNESLDMILNMISASTSLKYKLIRNNCYVITK